MNYCRKCGGPLREFVDDEGASRKRCEDCHAIAYENPVPVVLVLAEAEDGRILYTRKAKWPADMWGLVAGFVESGEKPEETVVREVYEETGMTATDPLYVGSDTLPGQLLLCYYTRVQGEKAVADSDADEVVLAPPDPSRIPDGAPARRLVEWLLSKEWMGRAENFCGHSRKR